MKNFNFIVFGEMPNTGMSQEDIEAIIQERLDCIYNTPVTFHYKQIGPDEIGLVFERTLDYAVSGNFIADEDMILLLGVPEHYFRPATMGGRPAVFPLIPYGNNFYIPDTECYDFYEMCMEEAGGQKVRDIQILPEKEKLVVRIRV